MRFVARASQIALILVILLTQPGCSPVGQTSATALPTVVLGNGNAAAQGLSGGATASGTVVPAEEAQLAFALAGKVEAVNVAVGDQVAAGQVLARLAGSEQLAAAVEAAHLEVLDARQALVALQDSAVMVTAQAELEVANAIQGVYDAERRFSGVQYPDVEEYQAAVADAEENLAMLEAEGDITEIGAAGSAVQGAQDAVELAQERLGEVQSAEQGCGNCDPDRMANAQDNLNGALNALTTAQLQQQNQQIANQQAMRDAQEAVDEAQRHLNAALAGPNQRQLAIAQGELGVARARLEEAKKNLEKVKDGPDPDQLAIAQARVASAEAQWLAAKSALEELELRAPFGGTITDLRVHASEWVVPGQPVLWLGDLQHLRVETTDLSERDVPTIEIGQPATVSVEALNQDVTGRVSAISPRADILGGDVVYKITIELEAPPSGLRAGMSVEARFGTGS